jgi:CRAL/TRIO domain
MIARSVGLVPLLLGCTSAFGVTEPVSVLVQKHVTGIARLKEEAQAVVGSIDCVPYNNDVFYLRYCLSDKGVDELRENLAWRTGNGKYICDLATTAFQKASAGEKWDNTPVRDGAPYADKINKFITPSQCLTTSSSYGDLVYCIRAGLINDAALMSTVTPDEMVAFFLYCKEINALVANDRSLEMDKLVYVITANDLNGLQLIGGDATFRKALGAASKQGNVLYPTMNGPTLLLNLPRLMSALVKLFTPLFPPEINARLKFERGPLVDVAELMDISYGGKDRDTFLKELEKLCY